MKIMLSFTATQAEKKKSPKKCVSSQFERRDTTLQLIPLKALPLNDN